MYVFHPTARLEQFSDRMPQVLSRQDLSYYSYSTFGAYDVEQMKTCLREHLQGDFRDQVRGLLRRTELPQWTIQYPQAAKRYKPAAMDLQREFPIISGFFASMMLSPEEFNDPARFGFAAVSDLVGTLGAHIRMQKRAELRSRDVTADHKMPDGTVIQTSLGEAAQNDFFIQRTDVTPYPATNLFGDASSYRPVLEHDKQTITLEHSAQPILFAIFCQYADQQNLCLPSLREHGKLLRDMLHIESAKDSFENPRNYFRGIGIDLPRLDEQDRPPHQSAYTISMLIGNGYFGAYIDRQDNLVFCREWKQAAERVGLRIPPAEVDDILQGMFRHAATRPGIGRHLKRAVEFRFSPEYDQYLAQERASWQKVLKMR